MFRLLLFIFIAFPFFCSAQTISTYAGNGTAAFSGDGGAAISAGISYFDGIVMDSVGNLYIADANHQRIRRVDHVTGIITTIAGNGTAGFGGDGGLAINAELNIPIYLALDNLGDLYFVDQQNIRVRKIDMTTGIISTYAGNGDNIHSGDGGSAALASFPAIQNIAIDKNDNTLYILDTTRIRKVDALTGVITTYAGVSSAGYSGDGGLATAAQIKPSGITVDSSSNLYLAEWVNRRIRKIDYATNVITTLYGDGTAIYGGSGVSAVTTGVVPGFMSFDKEGNIYLSESSGSNRIRKIDTQGIIHTVAGNGTNGYSGDGGLATQAQLHTPATIAFDLLGNMYFADQQNKRVRKVAAPVNIGHINGPYTFSFYPNPANTHLTIPGENLQSINITNTLGQIVHSQKAIQEKTEVDISSLNAGVYFVTVTDKQGVKVTKKVVKE